MSSRQFSFLSKLGIRTVSLRIGSVTNWLTQRITVYLTVAFAGIAWVSSKAHTRKVNLLFSESISCSSLNDVIETVESSTCPPVMVMGQKGVEIIERLYPDPAQCQRIRIR